MNTMTLSDYKTENSSYTKNNTKETSISLVKTLFLSAFVIALSSGLFSLYSASVKSSFRILTNQLVYFIIGIIMLAIIVFINEKIFKFLIAPSMLIILIICISSFFIQNTFFSSELFTELIYIIWSLYLSLYFSNRKDISKLRDFGLPVLFSIVFFITILNSGGLTSGFIFLLITVILFQISNATVLSIVSMIVFITIPVCVWVLTSVNNINKILSAVIHRYSIFENNIVNAAENYVNVLPNCSFWGVGLDNGTLKGWSNSFIYEKGIFFNIAQESGFFGIILIFLLIGILIYSSYKISEAVKDTNVFYYNAGTSLTFVLFLGFICNIFSVSGILPSFRFSLPFFSYGNYIIGIFTECAIIFKIFISLKDNKTENKKYKYNTSGSDFEVFHE